MENFETEIVEVENIDEIKNAENGNIESENIDEEPCKNIADHPYILDFGGHRAYVGENILLEQMNFRKFKNAVNKVILMSKTNRNGVKYWQSLGMMPDQISIFEQAILKGMKLDYKEMINDFNAMSTTESMVFIERIESLWQLCQIKTIESKLLATFNSDIEREKSNGEGIIYQNIATATEFIYTMFSTGLAEHTKLMRQINFDTYFVNEAKKGLFKKKKGEFSKDILIEDYLELPKMLVNECLDLADSLDLTEEEYNSITDGIEQLTQILYKGNEERMNALRSSMNYQINESMEYQRPEKEVSDLMFK